MKAKVKRTLYGILALLGGLLLYGVAIEPHLILAVDRQTVLLPHLPPSWDGQRVAVMGDLQVGMWWGNSDVAQRTVRQIVAAQPAVVVLLGDFVDQPTGNLRDELHTLTQILRPLTAARLPTYAVLGNHDYGSDGVDAPLHPRVAAGVRHALTQLGIQVLEKSAVALPTPTGPASRASAAQGAQPPLYVVGIGEQLAHDDRATAALDGVPRVAARIVILHDPVSFPQLPSASAPLGVAGHTHCGQVRIPFTAPWSWLWLVAGHPVPTEGWIAHYGQPGNHLYVNCGIGMSVAPLRLNDPPQITLFTLHRAH